MDAAAAAMASVGSSFMACPQGVNEVEDVAGTPAGGSGSQLYGLGVLAFFDTSQPGRTADREELQNLGEPEQAQGVDSGDRCRRGCGCGFHVV